MEHDVPHSDSGKETGALAIWKNTFLFYFLLLLLLMLGVRLLGFNGLYGQDSYAYANYANSCRNSFLFSPGPGPFFWPVLYPYLGGLIGLLFPVQYALQLLSLCSLIGGAWLFERIIQKQYHTTTRLARVYATLLSPFLLRAGLVVMSDMQGVFFLLLALNAFISLHTNNNRKYFLLFIIGVAGAVMTRYAMSLLLAPMLAYTGYLLLKQGTKATGHVLLALLLTGILLAPQLMMWFMKERGSFHVSWLTEWSPLNFMQTTFVNSNGNYHYTAQNILYAFLSFFHPGFCFCALFAVFFRKQIDLNNPVIKLSGLSLLLYGILLAGIPFQNLRFIIPAFPFFLLILFPVFEALEPKMKKYGILVFSALILFQLTLFVRAFLPFYKDNKEEKEIAEQCALFPNGHLYTFSITGAIEFYGASFSVIEMGNQKIDHLPNNSYLLFNKTAFEKEYEGKAPMLNYQFIATHYQLTEVKHWTGGWTLYAIR